jgi:hypothetical protein
MLGEKIGETKGKITGQRVLPSDGRPKVETSFQVSGALYGVEVTMMATYWSTVRADGTLYGECPQQGILMTKDGGMGTWTAAGVGKFTGQGSAAGFRGAIYVQTAPQQLARLSAVAMVYEWDIDAEGNAHGRFWEWK